MKPEPVYVVVRRSPDVSRRFVEIKGVFSTREGAQDFLCELVESEGRTSVIEKYWVFDRA